MLVGHRHDSQLSKWTRCTASASVTIKPGLQGVELSHHAQQCFGGVVMGG